MRLGSGLAPFVRRNPEALREPAGERTVVAVTQQGGDMAEAKVWVVEVDRYEFLAHRIQQQTSDKCWRLRVPHACPFSGASISARRIIKVCAG